MSSQENVCENLSPNEQEYNCSMMKYDETWSGDNSIIKMYYEKTPDIYCCNKMKAVFDSSKSCDPMMPFILEKMLDVPNLPDDYYFNILDCSNKNIVSIGFDHYICLLNPKTGMKEHIIKLEKESGTICSVSWMDDSIYLAVGTNEGDVELWNVEKLKREL